MKTVNVELPTGATPDRSYPIMIERGLLSSVGERMASSGLKGKAAIVTNPTVGPIYAARVIESLKGAGFETLLIEMPDGEEYKNLKEASRVYDALIEHRLERTSPIVALGGGVVGDLAGFVAATYLRGVPYVQLPTTLLSQVDSSIGGKTAVNHPKGKNLIGSFYQPSLVLIDPETLKTLEERELRGGIAEIVKHGIIRDAAYFSFLEESSKAIVSLGDEMIETIERSCRIKAAVVSADEREVGLRAILNFGHTFGHAIEAVSGYTTFKHGEAVSMGMAMAADLSAKLGNTSPETVSRVKGLLKAFGLPLSPPKLDPNAVLSSMLLDKKVEAGRIRFVLLKDIGEVELSEVEESTVSSFLSESLK